MAGCLAAFDVTNPEAIAWAEQHAADLVSGISETTRAEIRDIIERAFEEQMTVDEAAAEILNAIGDEARAELIARTEVMRASNEGQEQLWRQAEAAGQLTGEEQKTFIVTPDDRLCPICEPLDGETVGLHEDFSQGEPPVHPACRCTVGLVS